MDGIAARMPEQQAGEAVEMAEGGGHTDDEDGGRRRTRDDQTMGEWPSCVHRLRTPSSPRKDTAGMYGISLHHHPSQSLAPRHRLSSLSCRAHV
jgi:hypothetical protein